MKRQSWRRQPGAWLHRRFLMRTMVALTGFSLLLGIAIGWFVQILLPELAVSANYAVFVVGTAALLLAMIGPLSTRNIVKGLDAEKRVGQAIDYAVAAPGCAVAHNVTGIAKYGDIDHIVRTPARLWVVETKSGRVPKKKFRKVLAQIAVNVKVVREWMPNAEVQGCLVLASEEVTARDKQGYDAKGEKILIEDRKSLAKKLRSEARARQTADSEDIRRVWVLGKVEE